MMADEKLLFEAITPLGFKALVRPRYWDMIVSIKHPVMKGRSQKFRRPWNTPMRFEEARATQMCIFSIVRSALGAGFALL